MPIFARAPFAVIPMNRVAFTDLSTRPLINTLIQNPDRRRYYVLKVEPYNPATGLTLERWYSSGIIRVPGFAGLWKPKLLNAFNVSADLFEGSFGLGGSGSPSYGTIDIAIGDEGERPPIIRDDFAWLDWHRRRVTLYLGGHPDEGWQWKDYVPIFNGYSEETTWNDDVLSLIVRDPMVDLEKSIQQVLYLGTGGDEGEENLKGNPKPLGFGQVLNASPVLVDRFYLIYQVHSSQIVGIDNVYDKGDAYTNDGNLPGGITDLRLHTWLPTETGRFITDTAKGLFRLSTTPNGVLTVDFKGDKEGTKFAEFAGDVIRRILRGYNGWLDDALDLSSFGTLNAFEQKVSMYITNTMNASEVVDQLLTPNGFRTTNVQGQLAVGRVKFNSPVLTIAPPHIISIQRDRTLAPFWRLKLGYAKNWTLTREADLTLPEFRDLTVDFATNEFRYTVAEDPTVQIRNPNARDESINSLLRFESDADKEIAPLFELFKKDRDRYRVSLALVQFRVRVGQTVILKYPRFGLFDGRAFIVLSVTENTTSGYTDMVLWG